jgi:hypothetical protein
MRVAYVPAAKRPKLTRCDNRASDFQSVNFLGDNCYRTVMMKVKRTFKMAGMLLACRLLAAPHPDLAISANVNGAILTIRTSLRTAGAIDSITWRGKEFINAFDHGRELQSASSFDGYGECLNPTEGGSAKDGKGPTSSSLLISGKARGRTLRTTIEMAYWLAPGTPYPRACGSHADFRQAKNESVRSHDQLIKRVTIGAQGVSNAIRYEVTFVTAEDHLAATFEAITGYMPPEFSEFLAYDPATRAIVPLTDGPGEQTLPVILTTPDHNFAMGIFSPGLPQKAHPAAGYGRFRFPGTVKWNAVYRESPAPRGRYRYTGYVIVGSLDQVRGALDRLIQSDTARD